MIRKGIFILVAALVLTTATATFAQTQEGSSVDSGFYPEPVPETKLGSLPLGGKNLIDSAYSQFTTCSDWSCTQAETICVSESADKCHSDWVDTRVDGRDGNMLFVNGHGVLNPRAMEKPVVRYGTNMEKGVRYRFSVRSRNICGWCMDYPELSSSLSLELFTSYGQHVRHLLTIGTENDWVEYSVELTPEEGGKYQIVAYNLTCVWSGNDFALDAKLVEVKRPPHKHDDKCGHKEEGDDRHPPRPGSRRR